MSKVVYKTKKVTINIRYGQCFEIPIPDTEDPKYLITQIDEIAEQLDAKLNITLDDDKGRGYISFFVEGDHVSIRKLMDFILDSS